jgi:hypothetical protein
MSVRFTVTFVPQRGVDGVRALRWLLKRARRQFGLVAVDVREEESAPASLAADQEGQAESLSRLDGR